MSCKDFNIERQVNDDITLHDVTHQVFTLKLILTVLQYQCRRTVPCTERKTTTNPLAAAVKLIASPHVC